MSADANLDYARVRRRTAPEAKWLVNELAALRGRLDKVRERTAALRQKEVVLEKKIEALELVAAKVRLPEGTTGSGVLESRTLPRGVGLPGSS